MFTHVRGGCPPIGSMERRYVFRRNSSRLFACMTESPAYLRANAAHSPRVRRAGSGSGEAAARAYGTRDGGRLWGRSRPPAASVCRSSFLINYTTEL